MKRKLLKQTKNTHKHKDDAVWETKAPEMPMQPMVDYAEAFWIAAQELAGNHESGEIWALPIVFLARHAIELFVKQILVTPERGGAKVSRKSVLERSHNLEKQVADLQKLARVYNLHLSPRLIDLLKDFERDYPMGALSRYPLDRKGKPTRLLDEDSSFNLREFMERCQEAIAELEELRHEIMTEDFRDAVPEAFE